MNIFSQESVRFVPLDPNISVFRKYNNLAGKSNSYMSSTHFHNQNELVYVKEGNVRYQAGNEDKMLEAGDFFFIKRHLPHLKHNDTNYEMYVINFEDSFIECYFSPIQSSAFLSLFDKCYYKYDPDRFSLGEMNNLFKMLEKESGFDQHKNRQANSAPYILACILCVLCDEIDILKIRQDSRRVLASDITAYLSEAFSSISKIEDIASYFFISSSHLSRIFKAQTGVSIMAYVNALKIKQSKYLLKNTNFKTKDISEACGYVSSSYFNKCFKAATGYSPSDFRKQNFKPDIK